MGTRLETFKEVWRDLKADYRDGHLTPLRGGLLVFLGILTGIYVSKIAGFVLLIFGSLLMLWDTMLREVVQRARNPKCLDEQIREDAEKLSKTFRQ